MTLMVKYRNGKAETFSHVTSFTQVGPHTFEFTARKEWLSESQRVHVTDVNLAACITTGQEE